ncbi:2-oxo acid dehydrogenase subunit E2 [Hyalangium minutum]|uniref:Dihydrolipoamide acetyltransferase component of pyruvate dehydrogenase complex n=1 Tax=Hyalangium minutum TaxID=394096 RepID=A0A085VTV1_9BACT|nr:2-oxo acid dehydrogenase subunit E2 [Hyalangium minutum]KFE58864.1 hypothetical protein DB31_6161 [Hyalangium minutum]
MGLVYALPDLGEGVAEAEVVHWWVSEGDRVEEDAPMLEVTTAKATVQVPAPGKGVALRVLARKGDKVEVGMPLIVIGEAGEDADALLRQWSPAGHSAAPAAPTPQPSAPAPAPRSIQALPRVRKLAEQLGVSLEAIAKNGPITEEDVRAAAASSTARSLPGPARKPEPTPTIPAQGVRARVPLSGMRRTAAEHLTRTQSIPAVTVVEEASFDTLDLLQGLLGVSYVPFLIQAAVSAFTEVPEINALFDEKLQELVIYDRVDLAIAVHTEEGLAVPVIHDCAKMTLRELEARVQELGTQARARKLSLADSMGGTFTITSPGDAGALLATPLLNVPQVAILGLHRPTRRPVVADGELRVGLAAHVTLTHDHRVIDGLTACRFLRRITERLSHPLQALDEGVFRPGSAPKATAEAAAGQRSPMGGPEQPGSPATGQPGELARELSSLDPRKRRLRLEAFLDTELLRLMKRTRAIDRKSTWKDLGLDSLVAVGLRNVLVHALDRSLPATLLFNRTTPAALAEHLLGMLEDDPPETQEMDPDALLASLKGLPENEARARLAERLAAGMERR